MFRFFEEYINADSRFLFDGILWGVGGLTEVREKSKK